MIQSLLETLWHVFGSFIKCVYNEGLSSNFGCVKTALHMIEIILTAEAGRQTPDGRSARGQSRQSEPGLQGPCCSPEKHGAYLLAAAESSTVPATWRFSQLPVGS